MIRKAKRYFNTSGPNRPDKHYTLPREALVRCGVSMVKDERYFTIWAPRQTGKSTYFRMLAKELEPLGYQVLHTNLENFKTATEDTLLKFLTNEFRRVIDLRLKARTLPLLHDELMDVRDIKIVLIIDEVEGLNSEIFGQFLQYSR